jgi:hypothetical protein
VQRGREQQQLATIGGVVEGHVIAEGRVRQARRCGVAQTVDDGARVGAGLGQEQCR